MDNKRREFLLKATLGGGFLGLASNSIYGHALDLTSAINEKLVFKSDKKAFKQDQPIPQEGVGFIGVGNRGTSHVRQYAAMYPNKAKVVGVCDVRDEMAKRAAGIAKELGQKPAVYSGTLEIWREMLIRDDIHLVVIATPWEYHAQMAIEAMKRGKHVAVEVPMGITVEELNQVVRTSEETGRHCIMMENVNYGSEELWILNMVKAGVFGTLTYGEAAYIHNLREPYLFGDAYYNSWRMHHHISTDGNLYPTHGLGPVAWYMDIHRGDRFDYMVSMSSREASLSAHAATVDPANPFYGRDDFKHGDMNYSLIKTVQGKSILVKHDVVTARPYSRINALAGTGGYHEGYPSRLALEGKGHNWLSEEEYTELRDKYNHPIWDALKEPIQKHGGHGGMDFVMNYRILDCLNKGISLDMNVYDGAAWSAPFALSILSVQLGSVPVKFPDWTNGSWKEENALGIMNL